MLRPRTSRSTEKYQKVYLFQHHPSGISRVSLDCLIVYYIFLLLLTVSPSLQSEQSQRLFWAQAGAMVTPRPRPKEQTTMKRLRREGPVDPRILIPETATLAKRNVVMPPRTQSGMDVKNAAICGVKGKGWGWGWGVILRMGCSKQQGRMLICAACS